VVSQPPKSAARFPAASDLVVAELQRALVAAFLHGLEEMGYIEGQNVAIEYRWAEGRFEQLPALAADLVGRNVNVIAADAVTSTRAAKDATRTTPVVFISGSDPVERGFVASFARPGGNLTGVAMMVTEIAPKRFELLGSNGVLGIGDGAGGIAGIVKIEHVDRQGACRQFEAAPHV
jgi:hypothetical protein